MRRWLFAALALAGAGGWWWVDAQQVSERRVAALYAAQAQAWHDHDARRLCAQYAADFVGVERQSGASRFEVLRPDKDKVCANIAMLLQLQKAGGPKGLPMQFSSNIDEIAIAPDRRSAAVRVTVHLDLAGIFVSDSEAVERVAIRRGRVLFIGRQGESRVRGALAGGGQGA